MTTPPSVLINLAASDLQSAVRLDARSGVAGLAAGHEALAQAAERLGAAVRQLAAGPGLRTPDVWLSLSGFRAALGAASALHANAGRLCDDWRRALHGIEVTSYAPPGRAEIAAPAGRLGVVVEA